MADETARLRSLAGYQIVDSAPEAAFDRLTGLAANLFDAPIALISFIDADRQWFKSRRGLGAASTPRNQAFCSRAIAGARGSVFVVPDATLDSRFAANPLVTGAPFIRFYAGAVLSSLDGHNLGTLCVIDSRPRTPSPRELEGLCALARIVEDELELRRVNRHYRAMADNAPDIIAESTLDGVMTYISPACFTLTGYAADELVGRTFQSLMHPEDGPKVLEMCQAVFASGGRTTPWPVEFRAIRKDGQEIWMECKPTLVADTETGRFTGLIDVVRDITARKRLEQELREARAEAEAATAVKSEFLANMSHELRTPLTSIIGFTGLAEAQPDLPPVARAFVARVRDASRALLCTVNDILDFSKLEAGQVSIQPAPVSPQGLCAATLDLLTPQAAAKDVALLLDCRGLEGLTLSLDPDRVRQVLLNLVGNAVKFTESGTVTLRALYHHRRQVLHVDVIDTGVGLDESDRERLFQRFSQVDGSLTRKHGGTGLGLAICRGLVEAMGGDIGVQSTKGEGSRFWFTLPAVALSHGDEEAPPDEVAGLVRGARVLVADDHPVNRELVRLFLNAVGADVTEATGGAEAEAFARRDPFDVILMDLRMPDMDGFAAARRIRSAGGINAKTPILAFTADQGNLAERMPDFDGLVTKPVDPEVLISTIASMMDPADRPDHVDLRHTG